MQACLKGQLTASKMDSWFQTRTSLPQLQWFISVIKTIVDNVVHFKNTTKFTQSYLCVRLKLKEVLMIWQKMYQMMCNNLFSIQVDESTLPGNKC